MSPDLLDLVNPVACERHGEHSIELDCPPGPTRPWDLIGGVVRGTPLAAIVATMPRPHAFFGHARWPFAGFTCDEWDAIAKVTKPRVTRLYNSGTIRFGSW